MKRIMKTRWFWMVMGVLMCIDGYGQPCLEDDYVALRALYLSTDGDNWDDNIGWLTEAEFLVNPTMPMGMDLSSWHGVNTNDDGCVTNLNLNNNNLNGNIPSILGNITNLKELYLYSNNLNGNVPSELGNLTNLTHLFLYENNLSGNVQPELGNLTNLTHLFLYSNNLSGNVPSELGNLTNLKRLLLSINNLSGNIPVEIGNLTNLEHLSLSRNGLSGDIPVEIGNLTNLSLLALVGNDLSGNIPPELGSLTNLEYLKLNDNQLCGCYDSNLINLCNQLDTTNLAIYDSNREISDGNNLAASWEDFCANQSGLCLVTFTVPFTTSNPTCDNNNGSIELIPPITGCTPFTYAWDNAPNVQNPTGLSAGTYRFTVSDEQGSTGTGSVTLELPALPLNLGEDRETCLLPGVFDPTSGTLSLDIDAYENNQLSIYNRWGVRVFHANPYLSTAEWDGTYNGQLVPKGNYYAVLELEVGEIETEKKRMFIVY